MNHLTRLKFTFVVISALEAFPYLNAAGPVEQCAGFINRCSRFFCQNGTAISLSFLELHKLEDLRAEGEKEFDSASQKIVDLTNNLITLKAELNNLKEQLFSLAYAAGYARDSLASEQFVTQAYVKNTLHRQIGWEISPPIDFRAQLQFIDKQIDKATVQLPGNYEAVKLVSSKLEIAKKNLAIIQRNLKLLKDYRAKITVQVP